jgi:hypothetical protein
MKRDNYSAAYEFASFEHNLELYRLDISLVYSEPIELSSNTTSIGKICHTKEDGSSSTLDFIAKFVLKSKSIGSRDIELSLNESKVENFNFVKKQLIENPTVKFAGNFKAVDFLKLFELNYMNKSQWIIGHLELRKKFILDFMKGIDNKYICPKSRPGDISLCYINWIRDNEIEQHDVEGHYTVEITNKELAYINSLPIRKTLDKSVFSENLNDLKIEDFGGESAKSAFKRIFDKSQSKDLELEF